MFVIIAWLVLYKMKKTILFGAGTIASQIILYDLNINIVAIADNDKNKVGGLFYGIPIIAPASINNTVFDEVMITTGRVNEARAQLIGQLEISEEKVVLPRRHLSKPLQAFCIEANQNLAHLLLSKLTVSETAAKLGVIVDMDTLKALALFGTVRSQASLIHLSLPNSGLVTFAEYIKQILCELSATENFNWQLNPMKTSSGEIIAYLLDINLVEHETKLFSFIFRGYAEVNGYTIDLPSRAMFFSPLFLRSQTVLHRFGEITCRVPMEWEKYLTFMYELWQDSEVNLKLYQYQHRGCGALPDDVQQALKTKEPWIFVGCEDISIVLLVYNNIDYLNEAIESVLFQLVPYRVVVHCLDDASSDGCSELLREYQQKFSELLVLYISGANQGSGKQSLLTHKPDIKGNFWTFLSGDDFWLTPFNLWFQADYLLRISKAVGCACATIMRDEANDYETMISPKPSQWNLFDLLLLHKEISFYTHTSSILWRNIFYKERAFFLPVKFELPESNGDVMLAHFMLENGGEMHLLPNVMNFYRYSGKGVWSSISKEEQIKINKKLSSTLYSMISFRNRFLCRIHKSSIVPSSIKRIIRGPINGR
ncbi:glycosyltransferase family A protein [Rheinheimera metallidurans]|uniref:glycosyltransferase family A protein n=1 Tax=Rheinheimera metallidurans TaxID=2925781 RepID=UPI003001DF79